MKNLKSLALTFALLVFDANENAQDTTILGKYLSGLMLLTYTKLEKLLLKEIFLMSFIM